MLCSIFPKLLSCKKGACFPCTCQPCVLFLLYIFLHVFVAPVITLSNQSYLLICFWQLIFFFFPWKRVGPPEFVKLVCVLPLSIIALVNHYLFPLFLFLFPPTPRLPATTDTTLSPNTSNNGNNTSNNSNTSNSNNINNNGVEPVSPSATASNPNLLVTTAKTRNVRHNLRHSWPILAGACLMWTPKSAQIFFFFLFVFKVAAYYEQHVCARQRQKSCLFFFFFEQMFDKRKQQRQAIPFFLSSENPVQTFF